MNKIIEKINFKKVVIIYLILLIISSISIILFLGNTYKDKIKVLYNYHKLSEVFTEKYNKTSLQNTIKSLSKSSKDIIDIVIINNNTITYTTNKFYQNNLTSINNTNNYYKDSNSNIYKLTTKKEFISELFDINKDTKDDYYNDFKIDIPKEGSYTINYLKNKTTNEKIIIISKITPIKNGEEYLKISLAILLLFFMLYWIIVTAMIYQNALKLNLNAYRWGILTLLTNIIGVIIYLIFIKYRKACPTCHTNISVNDKYCKSCGEKL